MPVRMNDKKPDWYERLNKTEKSIIDVFVETRCRWLVARPELERRLCKTKLMNPRTLTARLDYLIIDRGILGKIVGAKGAVFYAPAWVIKSILGDPVVKSVVDAMVNSSPPKEPRMLAVVKVKPEHVSDAQMWGELVRAGITWQNVGVGTAKQKDVVYRDLRRQRKLLVMKKQSREENGATAEKSP